ncbi:MAG: SUMF1/EgtB/PvdO family nonheme iron enzyme [Candidatus Cloacimonas sp.]|jgi:formylglycine-generating enzyme required for sulfatase activity|nr:SUMF1/EgtB/PvdO family nonheme iron enzyme [Candidatus Cloacimonas sp.]
MKWIDFVAHHECSAGRRSCVENIVTLQTDVTDLVSQERRPALPLRPALPQCLCIAILLLILSSGLFADPLALQSFENTASDTWSYTASPSSAVPYFWGRTNQNLGGANAQSGSWYWGSWLMDNSTASLSFNNVNITPGTQHSLNFYYYTKNLDPATDQLKICLEYDTGTQWNNWFQLLFNTQAWSLFSVNIPQTASTVRVKILTQYANPSMNKYAHWDSFSIKAEEAEFTAPIIYNTAVAQRTDGSGLVDISYDLFDANGDLCVVGLKLSDDAGASFNYIPNPANLTGNVGENIAPGIGKSIVWDAGAEGIDFDGSQYMLRFSADDPTRPIPENFVFVEGGTIYPTSGIYTGSLTVSSFYIDKYELTNAEWNAVMGSNGGDTYPKAYVSWFGAIEYCNRRSLQEGLQPSYSYLSYGTDPENWPAGWNTNNANAVNVSCDWTVICYRLPSEAEWEYAARGGLNTHGYTYSGSNDLNFVGWYIGNSGNSVHPVGQLASNELGTFDMSGNLYEWCWDDFYDGSDRVVRGGVYNYDDYACAVSDQYDYYPTYGDYDIGFRVCRVSP